MDTVSYLTNESAFELETLPESLLVLGGRYIALECAQMFARFGSRVTVLQRSDRILPDEGPDLTNALTGFLREEGMEIVTGVSTRRVTQDPRATCSAKTCSSITPTACFHPYLTLSEGVKLAALAFSKDVKKLSCCAS